MPRDLEPKFCVFYTSPDGDAVQQKHQTKAQNDDFFKAMELMGVTDLTKSFYNPKINEWFRYHNDGPEPEPVGWNNDGKPQWQKCHINSCKRHQSCMYRPCRSHS